METKILKKEELNIDVFKKIGKDVRNGALVIFPTETVYGIGTNAFSKNASKKIFDAKGRPSDNPLIVHVNSLKMADDCMKEDIYDYKEIIEQLWPGPITFIFNKASSIPDNVTGGKKTVGIRFPSNEISKEVIKYSKVPIAAPSANISGKPSSTRIKHVIDDFFGRVDYIITDGDCFFGLESTIIDLSRKTPVLLRPGPISVEDIIKNIPDLEIPEFVFAKSKYDGPVLSPGMKYKHYSPDIKLILIDSKDVVSKMINMYEKNDIVFCSDLIYKELPDSIDKISLGNSENLYDIGRNIFSFLRLDFDKEKKYKRILCQGFSQSGIGLAIMNRLRKAADIVVE